MFTAFLTAHSSFIFWFGVVVEVVGSVWFLFDSYRCDVEIARWTMVFPPLGIYLVFRYPEECLKSFIVCIVGIVIITAGDHYAPPGDSTESIMQSLQSRMNGPSDPTAQ
jgi:hypothetical protein